MLASSVVDRGFKLQVGQTKDYEIGICCVSANCMQHSGETANTFSWLGIRKMCRSGATCLPTDCCFSELQVAL